MSGQELQLAGEDERALARLMARARIFADIPGLKKELAGKPQAVAGIMLTLEGFNLPVTLPSINDSFDWIQGRAAPTAHFYQAVALRNGYEIRPVERSLTNAIARISARGVEPIDVEYSLEMAIEGGRLDEWVESWTGNQNNWKLEASLTVRRNGEDINTPWPDWAAKRVADGKIKRLDAWWNYRADMLWKSAAKRAVKIACPHLLLGDVAEHSVAAGSSGKGTSAVTHPPQGEDVVDAEIIDDEPDPPEIDPDDPSRPFV